MRVLMLVWGYWPATEGGAERQCRRLVDALVQNQFECTVWTAWQAWRFPLNDSNGNVRIRRFGMLVPVSVLVGRWWDFSMRHVYQWLCSGRVFPEERFRKLRFWCLLPIVWLSRFSFITEVIFSTLWVKPKLDVIHVHEPAWTAGLGVWIGRRWKIPVVATEATYPALPVIGYDVPLRRLWTRLRLQCHYIAKHEQSRISLVQRGIPDDYIKILPNGVPLPESCADVGGNRNVLLVANLGQGAYQKSFDVLINSWHDVIKRCADFKLVIVGGGDASPWKCLADSLGCSDSIRFEGYCDDPARYYKEAAVFVLPSRVEGLSNALLEAQSWGVPAVVSDIAGNRAVIQQGENGVLVPVGNVSALSDAVVGLLADEEARKRMGLSARNRIRQTFSVDIVSSKLAGIYKDLKEKFVNNAE